MPTEEELTDAVRRLRLKCGRQRARAAKIRVAERPREGNAEWAKALPRPSNGSRK